MENVTEIEATDLNKFECFELSPDWLVHRMIQINSACSQTYLKLSKFAFILSIEGLFNSSEFKFEKYMYIRIYLEHSP